MKIISSTSYSKAFLAFALAILAPSALCATIILSDETWSGDVTLTSEVQIDTGVTLTVSPGAVIDGSGFRIKSYGKIVAVGTAENPISFNDLRLNFEGEAEFSNIKMFGGDFTPGLNGSLKGLKKRSSHFSDVYLEDIHYPDGDVVIEKNIFESSEGIDIGLTGDASVKVLNNVFVNQTSAAGAVKVWANYAEESQIHVEYNSFLSFDRVAISVETDGKFDAPNNYFGTTDKAIIDAMILDRLDSLERPGIVRYEPFLTRPAASGALWDSDGDGVADPIDAFYKDPQETRDTDGDGIGNNADVFPNDELETVDTDGDGIGNNADLDDDNDGFTDEEELEDGTNPLSRFSCRSGCFSFDIDENSEAKALTDGLLVIRHLFGFTGDALATGAISSDATRDRAEDISALLSGADSELDIDGNGESKALSDGLLLIRYLFGFTGDALTVGAIGEGATRDTSEAIEAYISDRVPASE